MSRPDLNPTAASLLGFLHDGPRTGWELDSLVRQSIGNFWNVTRSQIYRELRDLAGRGLVEVGPPGPRDRTPYELTAAGRRAFAGWIAEEPGPDLIRSRLLLTVFFGDHLDPGRLRDIVAEQRRHHRGELERFRAVEAALDPGSFPAATLRFGIAFEEAFIGWLGSLIGDGEEGDGTGGSGGTDGRGEG